MGNQCTRHFFRFIFKSIAPSGTMLPTSELEFGYKDANRIHLVASDCNVLFTCPVIHKWMHCDKRFTPDKASLSSTIPKPPGRGLISTSSNSKPFEKASI